MIRGFFPLASVSDGNLAPIAPNQSLKQEYRNTDVLKMCSVHVKCVPGAQNRNSQHIVRVKNIDFYIMPKIITY